MTTILTFGVFWTMYGIAGLLGFQVIPEKYKGHDWTKDFIRDRGLSWLMLGIPWLALYAIVCHKDLTWYAEALLLILVSLPAFGYTILKDHKYRSQLKE